MGEGWGGGEKGKEKDVLLSCITHANLIPQPHRMSKYEIHNLVLVPSLSRVY